MFLLAFIIVAVTSVAVTYLSDDLKDLFGKHYFTIFRVPDKRGYSG